MDLLTPFPPPISADQRAALEEMLKRASDGHARGAPQDEAADDQTRQGGAPLGSEADHAEPIADPGVGDGAETWPAPKPLPNELPPVPPFSARLLPDAFAPWVIDIAERMQCPPDFPAVATMVMAAGLVGRAIAIRPKRHDDWTVVPNLWGLVIGRSGIMKTPAIEEPLTQLERLVAEAGKAYTAQQQAYAFDKVKVDAQRAQLAKKVRQAVEEGADAETLRAEFDALQVIEPTERRYLVNDTTVEKLGELLNENPRGLFLERDEIAGLLGSMDRQGHENDRAFYCEAWNGTGSYTYDRIGRGTLHIKSVCLSLFGGTQPGPLAAYLREVFSGGARDDGFIQRFQLLVWPDVSGAWRNVDRWPDTTAKDTAFKVLQRLAHLDPAALGASPGQAGQPPSLRFDAAAQDVFDAWRAGLEAKVRDDDEHAVIVSHLSKYRSLMPSLALLVHLVDCVDRGLSVPVSRAAAECAVAWCDYLEVHARRVYYSITARSAASTGELAKKLRAGKLDSPFRARTVLRHQWSGLTELQDIYAAIDWLADLDWLRREEVPAPITGGKPTVQFHVNPQVRGHRLKRGRP
jgi:putative DNA primase/helicase